MARSTGARSTVRGLAALVVAAAFQAALPAHAQTAAQPITTTPASSVTQTAPVAPPPPERIEAPDTPRGAVGPTSAQPEVTAFDIVVRAPDDVRGLLEKHLELQRYRAVTDLDDAELARLIVLAERNVRNLVGTLGYFSPRIDITREGSTRPRIVVAVDPGRPTQIGEVAVGFSGDIAASQDPGAVAQREEIQRLWQLPANRRFNQDAWDGAKTQALRQLVARRYPAGRIASSLADVDAENYRANLDLKLDSGPLYRLGPMQVSGVERYDPQIVPRLARLAPGSIYDQNRLVEAQQRLAASGYFDSAYIFVDPESDPLAAPVQVQVREAKLQKLIFGIGVTTDSGPRASVEHTHHRVPGLGWRAVTKLQLERKSPFAQSEWLAPPDDDGWRWGVLGRAEKFDDEELRTYARKLRFGRSQAGDRIDRNIYVQLDRANVSNTSGMRVADADTGDGSALSVNYIWTGRYFDSVPFPSRGNGLGFELGGGVTLSGERKPFVRAVGRWLGIRPLERGRLALRAEGGAVVANSVARIPGPQLFRTGGDSSVRGYGVRDIGVKLASGVTGPGHYMAVGSVEWQRPIVRDGLTSDWEHTIFIDAGAVAEKPKDLRPSVGIGTGVRYKSPIGPLQADIAYGLKVKRLRLHVSVGFVF
ncbi:MAG: BamA/TamA family outer membrane protein [Burkholderiaceae bacterium]